MQETKDEIDRPFLMFVVVASIFLIVLGYVLFPHP
jgi:hypothetical protein